MNKSILRFILILSMLMTSALAGAPVWAASSVNVTLGRDVYDAMDFWAAEGLIGSTISSIRPYEAGEVGRQFIAAMDACTRTKTHAASCRQIKNHYAPLFSAEIAEAQSPQQTSHTYFKPLGVFSAGYSYFRGPASIFNNEGIDYGTGHNALVSLQSSARLFQVFSFFTEPVFIFNSHFGQTGAQTGAAANRPFTEDRGDTRADIRLLKGYAKLNLFNVELLVGRDSLWWGPGYHGALLMSNNAHPFDMIKLSNPKPVLLPWVFSLLGPVQFNLIFSQLNDERYGAAKANPFLYGLRLAIKPHPYLELGASHLVQFGGPGRRDLTVKQVFETLYGNSNRDGEKTDSNQQFSADIALTVPNLRPYLFVFDGLRIYYEIGGEDAGYPPDRRAHLAGVALFKPFGLEGAVLRGEYAILSPYSVPEAWYNHGDYPMRYEGRVFGHHAGSDAEDIFLEWSHRFDSAFYKLGFDHERSGVQRQGRPEDRKNQYFAEAGWQFQTHYRLSLRYLYEDITNANSVSGERQNNSYLGVEAALFF